MFLQCFRATKFQKKWPKRRQRSDHQFTRFSEHRNYRFKLWESFLKLLNDAQAWFYIGFMRFLENTLFCSGDSTRKQGVTNGPLNIVPRARQPGGAWERFWEPLGACGSLCEPLGTFGSLREPLGASGAPEGFQSQSAPWVRTG